MGKIGQIFLHGSWAALTTAWTVAGGVFGLLVMAMTDKWIPVWLGLGLGPYVALCVAYHNKERERARLKELNEATEKSAPRILFDVTKHSRVRLNSSGDQKGEKVAVWQLWFVNRPEVQSSTATAKNLEALIQFYNPSDRDAVVEFSGQWALTHQPAHVGWGACTPRVDLRATHERAKLQLLAESEWFAESNGKTEREVHGLAGENLHAMPLTANHPSYKIPVGATRVRVALIAENMREQEMTFRVERTSDGGVSTITHITP